MAAERSGLRQWPWWTPVALAALAGVLVIGLVAPAFRNRHGRSVVASATSLTAAPTPSSTTTSTTLPATTSTSTSLTRPTTTTALTVRLSNPIDIQRSCAAAGQSLAGGGVPLPADQPAMIAAYQEQERDAQQAGATVRAPSLDAFCADWIKKQYPDKVAEYNFLKAMQAFNGIIGGTPSGTIPPGGICRRSTPSGYEYQTPTVGSCPAGWELVR